MSVGNSSVKKGETLIDTAMTLNAMRPDVLVIRHSGRRRRPALPEGLLLGRQCRRRTARTSDPGAARRADHPPRQGQAVAHHRGDLRRRAALPRGALQYPAAQCHGRARPRRCAGDTPAPGIADMGVEVFHDMKEGPEGRRCRDDAPPAARAHVRRLRAIGARIFPLLRPRCREAQAAPSPMRSSCIPAR